MQDANAATASHHNATSHIATAPAHRHFESNKFKFNENMNMDTVHKINAMVMSLLSSDCQSRSHGLMNLL